MRSISTTKRRSSDCTVIKRNGKVYVINRQNPKLKQLIKYENT